ncbi:hypothetical protein GCM10023238_28350 [Streptomyces heliomycini]
MRRRPPRGRGGLPRQALILVLLIAVAFGTAVYMGVRHPYRAPVADEPAEPLRTTVIPLAPRGEVPGTADVDQLYARSPARSSGPAPRGAAPASRRTAHFSDGQVVAALFTAKDYLRTVRPRSGRAHRRRDPPVRVLLDPGQLDQFDRASTGPTPTDGTRPPMAVRFDPARVRLADRGIRVQGTMRATETDSATLEGHHGPHVRLRAAPGRRRPDAAASLFTVRRELRLRFDRDDLRLHRRNSSSPASRRSAVLRRGLHRPAAPAAGGHRARGDRPRRHRSVRHGQHPGPVRLPRPGAQPKL